MQNIRPFTTPTLALLLALSPAAAAQDASRAQVPPPVTSSPSSPFGPPPPPDYSLPDYTPQDAGNTTDYPELPSIEAEPLPLPERGVQEAPLPPAPDQDSATDAPGLPAPTGQPMAIAPEADPVLALGRAASGSEAFRMAIAAAITRNPALDEAEATAAEASALRSEAVESLLPSAQLNVTSYTTVSRAFSNDPDNIIERSRARARTDAQLSINQTLFDFGAGFSRIAAGASRMRAAAAGIDDISTQIALRTIAAWYEIYTYRALLMIGRIYTENQADWRNDFSRRVSQGVNAEVDVARIDSSLATLTTRLARYERALANAEAQFAQLTGRPAPAGLGRAPFLGALPASVAEARASVGDVPAVRSAVEVAAAVRREAQAVGRQELPQVSVGIDAGRYGVFETERDYDVRARITLTQRLGGGAVPRIRQAEARAAGAAARAARIEEEAARDAAVAWSDLQALERQTEALEQGYIAARQSRDATEARFRISRGTLFDVINANDAFFGAAAAYVESLADRDAAHYVLLARTGRLLDALQIDSAYQWYPHP